jgi:hypothetical protein
MTPLVLKRASASRPSGEWSDNDYDVLADVAVVRAAVTTAAGERVLAGGKPIEVVKITHAGRQALTHKPKR